MEFFFVFLVIVIILLSIIDLMVGVSNDAVNFLNSAIGSKAFPIKTILITASLGLGIGAFFSSGLLEITRTGIFDPGFFSFKEITILFAAVVVADIFLLNFFNTVGIPTSTTVSILFCLFGAAVALGLIQLYTASEDLLLIENFINTSKIFEIGVGIFLSILLAFILGSIVQFISRLAFTFEYQKNIPYFGAAFSSLAITSVLGFIVIKGFKGISIINDSIVEWTLENLLLLFIINLLFWGIVSHFIIKLFKEKILKFIILLGLFGLALSFAGNDLVNFIGVPIASYQSWQIVEATQTTTLYDFNNIKMSGLKEVSSVPYIFLLLSGVIMIITLWFSKRSLYVTQTELNLANQFQVSERFNPTYLSRIIVKLATKGIIFSKRILPKAIDRFIEKRFVQPDSQLLEEKKPSFDLIRAAVNLSVASVLISFATSLKLPLSTTYVTFMVAMGTALADRAWTSESAVYRVAGVLNVIGSWIITSFAAFLLAAIIAILIYVGKWFALIPLLLALFFVLFKSFKKHRKQLQKEKEFESFLVRNKENLKEKTLKHSENIAQTIKEIITLYINNLHYLATQDYRKLKNNKNKISNLKALIEGLKENEIRLLHKKDDDYLITQKFFILNFENLEDVLETTNSIITSSKDHTKNYHKKLTFNQIRNLKHIANFLQKNQEGFNEFSSSENIEKFLERSAKLNVEIKKFIEDYFQKENSSFLSGTKNFKLYIKLLRKSKELNTSINNLLIRHQDYYKNIDD